SLSPTLGRQFGVLINVATVLALVVYGYCALALVRFSREIPAGRGRALAVALGVLGAGFCAWLVLTSEPSLLVVSLVLLAAAVPAWLALRAIERRRAPAATTS